MSEYCLIHKNVKLIIVPVMGSELSFCPVCERDNANSQTEL